MRRTVLTLLAIALVAGCSRRAADIDRVRRVGPGRLVSEATRLRPPSNQEQRFQREVVETSWPASIQELRPEKVYVAGDGVYVRTYHDFVRESGIFIAFPGTPVPPTFGDPAFEAIAPSVYWYHIEG